MPPSRIAACLLLGLAALPAWAAQPARAATLLLPVESARDEYAETFTFVADLDDGSYVQLQLAITNIGPGAGTGLCRALVKRPGAAAWTSHARVGRAGWHHQAGDDGEALTIGPCAVRSGDRTTVRAALAGRTVELTFPGPLLERAPPTALLVGDRSYRATVLQAFTPAEVRLGGPALVEGPLGGGGYADHSRSEVSPADLALGWVRFRALRPPHRLLALGRQLPDGRFDPAWIWLEGEAPRPLKALGLARQPGAADAWTATLGAGAEAGALTTGSRLFSHSPLRELGAVGRLVGAVMTVPVTHTFRARLEGAAPADGILEVTVQGED